MSSDSVEHNGAKAGCVLATASQGTGGDDELRLRGLLERTDNVTWFAFDYKNKKKSFVALLRMIAKVRPSLVVMEGTGLAAGFALILGRIMFGVPYVFSSGDAVGPFVAAFHGWLGPAFSFYEKLFCRHSAGFIGWTPYLAGRALSFGAPRAMTAAGWAPHELTPEKAAAARQRVRAELGIPNDAIVVGIVGSMAWNRKVGFCYGYELVGGIQRANRAGLCALIVGDGSGMEQLKNWAAERLGKTIFLPGRVAREKIPEYLAAMDIASLPQSVDQVGSFRYSTKLSEYLAAGLPVVTGRIPVAYDLDGGWIWRVAGDLPWGETYANALGGLLSRVTREEIAEKKSAVPRALAEFSRSRQIDRTTHFLTDILEDLKRAR